MTEQQPDAISAATSLRDALRGMSERLDTVNRDSKARDLSLKKYGRRNRFLVLLDVAVTVFSLVAVGIALHNGASISALKALNTHLERVVACQSRFNAAAAAADHDRAVLGNASAVAQETLWRQFDQLVTHPASPGAAVRIFQSDLSDYFTAIDRVRMGKVPPLPSPACR